MRRHVVIEKLVEPTVTALGYQFEGLEYQVQGKYSVLRIFIDKVGGVTVEDCQQVSRHVGALLGVEEVIKAGYNLEVSSPGLDRLLFTQEQFEKQLGKMLSVKLAVARDNKKNYTGTLQEVSNEEIILTAGVETVKLSLAEVDEARVVPQW